MTIEYLSSKRIQGLSSDTKPTNVPDNTEFVETNTGNVYKISSGTWSLLNSATGSSSTLDSLTDVDTTTTPPTNNQVLTYNTGSSQWVPATPPGAGGGEANTYSNAGAGGVGITLTKSGVNLPFKSINTANSSNITVTNDSGNNEVDLDIGANVLTTTNTKTVTGKTINVTDNVMPNMGSYAYSIYQEGGAVKLLNNSTGAVTSHATLGPAVDAVLANTNNPTAVISAGQYNLASGFGGWILVSKTRIKCDGFVIINVPQGFTGSVWNITNSSGVIYGCTIDGGLLDEQGTQANNWVGINIGPTGTGATHSHKFRNIEVWRANAAVWIHTTGTTWANDMWFDNIEVTACKYLGFYDHSGTYTLNTSGPSNNHWSSCSFQTTGADGTNHYPQALGGIVGVVGQWNQFTDVFIWDITGTNSSAAPMTIGANGNATLVIGGGLTYGVNFVDSGTNTMIMDEWHGLYNKNTLNQVGNSVLSGSLSLSGLFNLVKTSQSSTPEDLFSMSVSDASGDSFTLGNSSSLDGVFAPVFRSTQTSTAAVAGLAGMYFQTIVKVANDTIGGIACNVIAGQRQGNAKLTARAILGVYNLFDLVYAFYPDYADFANKQLRSTILAGMRSLDVVKTAAYTATAIDHIIRCDPATGGAAFTVTLPTAASIAGTQYTIIKADSGILPVTVDAAGSETINGILNWVLRHPNSWITIESDGANWKIISHGPKYGTNTFFRGGATPNRTYIAGMLPGASDLLQTSTTGPTANTLYAFPFLVQRTTVFDTIRCQVTTGGASSNLRLGLYADDGSGIYPGKLLFDSTNISAATNGTKEATITSTVQTLQPGIYWLTYENSATVPQIRCLPAAGGVWAFGGYASDFAVATPQYGWTVSHTVGALPDPYTAGATALTTASSVTTPAPAVGLRAA